MIDESFIRAWADDLRSGRFKQGCDSLRIEIAEGGEHYCCLGVAALRLGYEVSPADSFYAGSFILRKEIGFQEACSMLVEDHVKAIDELLGEEGLCYQLAEWNDEGMSFEAIADKIDSALEKAKEGAP